MKVITLASAKGGVGKSTIAFNLAYSFEGVRTGLLDMDLQGSISQLNLLAKKGPKLIPYQKDLSRLRSLPYELILVDTPPYLSRELPEIFRQSDLVLVPIKTGFFDILALEGTLSLIRQSMDENPNLKAGIVFNMVKHHSSLLKEIKLFTSDNRIPVLDTYITDRVSYTRSTINGGIINSEDFNAQIEMVNLCEEIMNLLQT